MLPLQFVGKEKIMKTKKQKTVADELYNMMLDNAQLGVKPFYKKTLDLSIGKFGHESLGKKMSLKTKIKVWFSKIQMMRWVKKHPYDIVAIEENEDGSYKIKDSN